MQPDEAVYMKTNVKSPGFTAKPIQSELEVNYNTRFFAHQKEANPDAYTRLILDVLQGRHGAFVRDDELRRAWEIFTPLLKQIENENIQPIVYKQGSRGPVEADKFISEHAGYIRNEDYVFYETNVVRKTDGSNAPPVLDKPSCIIVPEEELCDVGLFGLAVMVRILLRLFVSCALRIICIIWDSVASILVLSSLRVSLNPATPLA
jgi:hypothetical protein